jgi:photosystem II stability/assembly factor-like uncharacterized protein
MIKSCSLHVCIITALAVHFCTVKAQWVQTDILACQVKNFFVNGNDIFAATDSGVFRSTDNGINWTSADSGLPSNTVIYSVAMCGKNIFAGTSGKGIYLSTNNGNSWAASYSGNFSVVSFAVNGNNIFAATGTTGKNVYLSTNNGTNWASIPPASCLSLAASGDNIFAGDTNGYIYRSTNNGTVWNVVYQDRGSFRPFVMSIVVSGSDIFAGICGYVYLSTDNGASWHIANSNGAIPRITDLAVFGNNVFAGTEGGGVCLSTDNGSNWITKADSGQIKYSALNGYINSVAVCGQYIFAATYSGVWRRVLSEMVGINRPSTNKIFPQNGIRFQRYNKSNTAILFSLSRPNHISITMFNLSGKVTAKIIDKKFTPGTYKLPLDIRNIAAGNYIVRMNIGTDSYLLNTPIWP